MADCGLPVADVIALKEGADLDLNCPIEVPQDDLIISWTCNDEPANIRSSRIRVTDSGNLRIYSAKVGDSCDYRCETAGGFGTISVVIKVIIVDKSMLDKMPRKNSTLYSTSANEKPDKHAPTQSVNYGKRDPSPPTSMPETSDDKNAITRDQMEIQLEPSEVHIDRNRTFGLECKVKHAPQITMAPQIIWLKELTGSKPATLSEAHERNIILIDNGFYHTLNWPKSITQRRRSSSTNSALLVRQANSVHSGRYICLAGYPPTIMGSNLTFAASASPISTRYVNGQKWAPSHFDYKMAASIVKVRDANAQLASSVDSSQGGHSEDLSLDLMPTNGLVIFALILVLVFMLCIVLVLAFFFPIHKNIIDCFRGRLQRNNKSRDNAIVESNVIARDTTIESGHELYSSPLAIKVEHSHPMNQSEFVTENQAHLDGDHVYSEIDTHDTGLT